VFKEHGSELVKLNVESNELVIWSFTQVWLPNMIPLSKPRIQMIVIPECSPDHTFSGRFLPSWLPGIQFPSYVKRGQHLFGNIRNSAFNIVQRNIVRNLVCIYFWTNQLPCQDEGVADFSVLSHYLGLPDVPTTHLRDATAMMYMGMLFTSWIQNGGLIYFLGGVDTVCFKVLLFGTF
jgi:hypothetical protein